MNNPTSMKPTFESTVKILVEAYLNDTLVNGDPCGCAVGNLVAYHCGYQFVKHDTSRLLWSEPGKADYVDTAWFDTACGLGEVDDFYYKGLSKEQIDSTGYTPYEVARIEYAFECAPINGGDHMFNGLMAVVDVLAEIHEVDLSVKESAKKLFVKA
jgi:hypothetical protein